MRTIEIPKNYAVCGKETNDLTYPAAQESEREWMCYECYMMEHMKK